MRTEFSNQCVVNYEVKTLEFNHLRLQGASNSLRFTLKMFQCLFETFKFVLTVIDAKWSNITNGLGLNNNLKKNPNNKQ